MLPKILLIDDEAENLKALERTLRGKFELVLCSSGTEALSEIEKQSFSVVVSDQRMPGMLGTELLAIIAAKKPLVSRVILTAHTDTKEILEAINKSEIYRYIVKPWDNQDLIATLTQAAEHHRLLRQNLDLIVQLEEKNRALQLKEQELVQLNKSLETSVEERTQELRIANEKLSELAMTDSLTKALNRRAFDRKLMEEIDRSSRYRHTIVVAMIDVDHFKSFNDMEGHVFGDEALRKIAQLFTSNLRKSDTLARYGGEEFVVMMPETRLTQGAEICERLRAAVENTKFQGQKEAAFLTVSIGLAEFPDKGPEPEELVKSADQALYGAKNAGRNRVFTTRNVKTSFFVS